MTLQMVSEDYELQVLDDLCERTGLSKMKGGWEWSLSAFSPAVRTLKPLDSIPGLGVLGKGMNGKVL